LDSKPAFINIVFYFVPLSTLFLPSQLADLSGTSSSSDEDLGRLKKKKKEAIIDISDDSPAPKPRAKWMAKSTGVKSTGKRFLSYLPVRYCLSFSPSSSHRSMFSHAYKFPIITGVLDM
jgi:hypothetical protein